MTEFGTTYGLGTQTKRDKGESVASFCIIAKDASGRLMRRTVIAPDAIDAIALVRETDGDISIERVLPDGWEPFEASPELSPPLAFPWTPTRRDLAVAVGAGVIHAQLWMFVLTGPLVLAMMVLPEMGGPITLLTGSILWLFAAGSYLVRGFIDTRIPRDRDDRGRSTRIEQRMSID